jgi:hypothetical protein
VQRLASPIEKFHWDHRLPFKTFITYRTTEPECPTEHLRWIDRYTIIPSSTWTIQFKATGLPPRIKESKFLAGQRRCTKPYLVARLAN